MTLSITELNASTEELEQALAGLLVHAREEVLSDTEVHKFWRICQEIHRRCSRSGVAAPEQALKVVDAFVPKGCLASRLLPVIAQLREEYSVQGSGPIKWQLGNKPPSDENLVS